MIFIICNLWHNKAFCLPFPELVHTFRWKRQVIHSFNINKAHEVYRFRTFPNSSFSLYILKQLPFLSSFNPYLPEFYYGIDQVIYRTSPLIFSFHEQTEKNQITTFWSNFSLFAYVHFCWRYFYITKRYWRELTNCLHKTSYRLLRQ